LRYVTHPLLSRAHLEAQLVAHAIVQPQRRATLLAGVDRDRVSPACWALLAQLADPDTPDVRTDTEARQKLADRAEAVTVADLCLFPADVTLALCNQLPERVSARRTSVLDVGTGAAA
jgi:hypothetical protein